MGVREAGEAGGSTHADWPCPAIGAAKPGSPQADNVGALTGRWRAQMQPWPAPSQDGLPFGFRAAHRPGPARHSARSPPRRLVPTISPLARLVSDRPTIPPVCAHRHTSRRLNFNPNKQQGLACNWPARDRQRFQNAIPRGKIIHDVLSHPPRYCSLACLVCCPRLDAVSSRQPRGPLGTCLEPAAQTRQPMPSRNVPRWPAPRPPAPAASPLSSRLGKVRSRPSGAPLCPR